MVLPSIKKKVDSCVSRKFESSKRSCELDSLKVHKHTVVFKLFYRSLTNVTDVYIQSFIDRHKALIWIKKFGDRSLIYKIRMWIDGEKVGEKYTTNCPMCTILLMGTGQVSWKYSDSEWISIQEYNSRNKKINICRPSIPKSLTNPLKLDEKIMNGNLNKPSLASKAFRMMSILECNRIKKNLAQQKPSIKREIKSSPPIICPPLFISSQSSLSWEDNGVVSIDSTTIEEKNSFSS